MLVIRPDQTGSVPLAPKISTPNKFCTIRIAIKAIGAVGLILITTGVGCAVARHDIPAIALLVAGAVACILGFSLGKRRQKNTPSPLAITIVPSNEHPVLQIAEDEKDNRPMLPSESVIFLPAEMGNTPVLQPMIFGKEEWMRYIGDPGEVPPLPENIQEILAGPCPFSQDGKTIGQTHLLLLMPKRITRDSDTKLLTLMALNELVKSHRLLFRDFPEKISLQYGQISIKNSYWVLMTKNILPESGGMKYVDQKKLLNKEGYHVPHLLEVGTSAFMRKIHSNKRLLHTKYTRCEEKLPSYQFQSAIGRFSKDGSLSICDSLASGENCGVLGVIRFMNA
jgi:hypothetical protein